MQLISGCDKDGGLFVGIVATSEPQFANLAVIIILITTFITTIIFFVLNKLCKEREVCVLSKQFLE